MARLHSAAPTSTPWNRDGFTLVELMVAIMILAIVLVSMAAVMTGVANLQRQAESRLEMTAVAESKLENLRASATAGTPDTVQLVAGGSLGSFLTNYSDSVVTPQGRFYYRQWLVASGPGDVRDVTLRVTPKQAALGTLSALDLRALILVKRDI